MITQTGDDWRRMVAACAAAAGCSGDVEAVHLWLNGVQKMHDGEHCRYDWHLLWTVARALGIDKRRRLEWRHPDNPDIESSVARVGSDGFYCMETGRGWEAGPLSGPAMVYDHPTRDSAIEHLERLLGRGESA